MNTGPRQALGFALGLIEGQGAALPVGDVADGEYLVRDGGRMVGGPGGSAGVTSVNGDAGPVVELDAGDVGAATPAEVDIAASAAATAERAAHESEFEHTQIPTADQKAALAGSDGTPGSGNKYVTDSDARNTNARTPSAHASSHVPGGTDAISESGVALATRYGTGRDGDLVFNGTDAVTVGGSSVTPSGGVYTLVRDVLAVNVTMSGCTIALSGFRFLAAGTFTSSGTNVLHDDGNNSSGGAAGAALANTTSLNRSGTAGGGQHATAGNGTSAPTGPSRSNAGAGGAGGAAAPQTGGAAGVVSAPAANDLGWFGPICVETGLMLQGGTSVGLIGLGCGSGGGGGALAASDGGVGGAGGGGGGFCFVCIRAIVISSGTLTFRARGGNGANSTTGGGGNAGGGGGGGGGYVQVVCETCSGTPTLSAAGGTGGTPIAAGTAGADGSPGRTRLFIGASAMVAT